MIEPGEVVLLIVEEAHSFEAKRRRDRGTEAVLPVEDIATAEDEQALWTAMGFHPGEDFDRARYHKVCIVASETSPVREWVTAFFNSWMHPLVVAGGLFVCTPPFERDRVTGVRESLPPVGPPTGATGEGARMSGGETPPSGE